MNPKHPIYIVSKGRWETRMTAKALDALGIDYSIVVEQQEYDDYASVIGPARVIVLDRRYQEQYETYDDLGSTKSKGPGPARNFAWDHSVARGATWHWVMDDNIGGFFRFNRNLKIKVASGTIFRVMEDFCERYENVLMAGPAYEFFVKRRFRIPPYYLNTRIYSCNLIRNDAPYRWQGRYNEDTDLSLRMLKDGHCTIQFNAFLQDKMRTQALDGGCTGEFYAIEGTGPKSQMLEQQHPDVARVIWRFGRTHHWVDYRPFRKNKLRRKPDAQFADGIDEYGMVLKFFAERREEATT